MMIRGAKLVKKSAGYAISMLILINTFPMTGRISNSPSRDMGILAPFVAVGTQHLSHHILIGVADS